MTIPLPRATTGLYSAIADRMAKRIEAGEWPPGEMIPRQDDLAAEYRVSLTVIAKASRILRGCGLPVTEPREKRIRVARNALAILGGERVHQRPGTAPRELSREQVLNALTALLLRLGGTTTISQRHLNGEFDDVYQLVTYTDPANGGFMLRAAPLGTVEPITG